MNNYLFASLICGLILFSNVLAAKIPDNKYHDYRAQYIAMDLLKMQQFHLHQAKIKIANNQAIHAWGDLAYLLCHIPNHHDVLQQMQELAIPLNKHGEMLKFYEKAIKIFPTDGIIYALYALYLAQTGDNNKAEQYMEIAIEIDPQLQARYFAKNP